MKDKDILLTRQWAPATNISKRRTYCLAENMKFHLFFCHHQSQNNWKPYFDFIMCEGLAEDLKFYNPTMTIYFLYHPPSHLEVCGESQPTPPHGCNPIWPVPPPSPAALGEEFLWSNPTINIEPIQNVLQFSLRCHTVLWLHCDFHLIIFNISLLNLPMRKSKLTLILGCHSACLQSGPLAALSCFSALILVSLATGQTVPLSAWLSWESSDLSGLEPDSPSWL